MDSDLSEPAVLSETASGHMSSDMSRPLSDKLDGTTQHTHVANTCLPAGERLNKMPIFNTGSSETRAFLTWLRVSSPGGLTAQLKGEKLMAIPSTASGFRVSVSVLQSLNGKEVVSFHTFTLPEDQCVLLLVKNLGRGTPESIIREELESMNIRFQRVTWLQSTHRDQDPAKDRPTTPPLHCISGTRT